MSTLKSVALAAAVTVALPLTATAADIPLPQPYVEFGGWYLRGDIGMTNQQFRGLHHVSFDTAPGFTFLDKGGFESGPLFGLGIGYQYNSWLPSPLLGLSAHLPLRQTRSPVQLPSVVQAPPLPTSLAGLGWHVPTWLPL